MDTSNGDGGDDAAAAVVATHGNVAAEKSGGRPHLRVLPPAANWYCSQVCDWGYDTRNERWLIVYGAKNGICIYEFNAEDSLVDPRTKTHPPTLEQTLRSPLRTNFVALLPRGKKDGRVTALRCLRDADGELRVVCAGEEGAVQIWDPLALRRVDQHRKHSNAEISAIGVRSELDPNWIVAGDRQGVISVWQRDIASVQTFTPLPRDAVFSMDIAPHDKALVAVGYRSGALCVVDAVEKTVRYRLDGHDLEVQAAVWAPRSAATQYLATASRDRTIKVWSFAGEASEGETIEPALCAKLEVRKPQQASSHSQSTRLWLPLAWTSSSGVENGKYGLWSGSFEGNLQLWMWNGAPRGSVKPSLVAKNGHNRLLFGIVPMAASHAKPPSYTDENGVSASHQLPIFATISLDRDLCVWTEPRLSVKTPSVPTCEERIPAQGGFVYSLDFNHARKLLACGVGDQTIRLWNFTAKHVNNGYHSELVWKGLQSKITCVRWHPIQDHILAFGTEDGRVAIWDLKAKTSQRLKANHSGSVRHLEWTVHSPVGAVQDTKEGAATDDDSFKRAMKALESAQAHGQTLEDALEQQEKDTVRHGGGKSNEPRVSLWSLDQGGTLCCTDVEKLHTVDVRKDCAAFAWEATFSSIAIGLSSGKVEIWKRSSQPLAVDKKNLGLELQKSIHEHKDSVSAVAWSTSTSPLLASSSTAGDTLVYEGATSPEDASSYRYKPVVGYGEHVVAVLHGHSSKVNCLRWNEATNESLDLLASCGDDGNIYVWSIATQAKQAAFSLHAGRVFAVVWMTPTILGSSGQDQSIRIWDLQDHFPKVAQKPLGSPSRAGSSPTVSMEKGSTPSTTPTPKSIPVDDQGGDATVKLASTKTKSKKKSEKIESIFSDQNASWMLQSSGDMGGGINCRKGIAAERKLLEEAENWERAAEILLLEGRVGEALQVVASHGLLNDTWVAYAPMAGQDVWREVSQLYALQLKKNGDLKRAALQFLTLGKVESAVQCLVAAKLYPEALSLIHLKLGSRHALLQSTLWEYAEKLVKKKQLSEAVRAYLSIGSTEALVKAVTILGSTGAVQDAKTAMTIWATVVTQAGRVQRPKSDEQSTTVPTSVFTSILALAVRHRDFDLATETVANLTELTDPASPKRVLYKLSQCVLRVAAILDVPPLPSAGDISLITGEEDDETKKHEARLFLDILRRPSHAPWSVFFGEASAPAATSLGLWSSVLVVCQQTGLWFDGSDLVPDEVVEQLGDEQLCGFMLTPWRDDVRDGSRSNSLIQLSQHVLKFIAELMSGYLLSALEALRDLLSFLSRSPAPWIVGLHQLFPGGLLDVSNPPAFGELQDEAEDTQALWTECFLLQCDMIIQLSTDKLGGDNRSKADPDSLPRIKVLLDGCVGSSNFPASLKPLGDRLQGRLEFATTEEEPSKATSAILCDDEKSTTESKANAD